MKQRIKHTKRTLSITIMLILVAIGIQCGVFFLLRNLGLPNGSPMLVSLSIIPGGAGWYLPFHYAFNLPREKMAVGSDSQ